MATTSPDNLRTPNPGDPYNLVADLATLASDTQTALNKKVSNLLKGTAAERVAATGTATNGMLWQDTDGIKMIWRKDGAAWVPAVWEWAGSAAQRDGFTQAPNGFKWTNTENNRTYLRLSSAWRPEKQSGNDVMVKSGASANVSYPLAITFPEPFGVVPNVQATASSTTVEGLPFVVVGNVTSTGFTASMTHNFATRDLKMNWSATLV